MCEHHGDYQPLAEMVTTGPAHLDREGALVESGEYVAALYESYAADQEWNQGVTYLTGRFSIAEYGEALASLSSYCRSAEGLAEAVWQKDVEDLAAAVEWPECP